MTGTRIKLITAIAASAIFGRLCSGPCKPLAAHGDSMTHVSYLLAIVSFSSWVPGQGGTKPSALLTPSRPASAGGPGG